MRGTIKISRFFVWFSTKKVFLRRLPLGARARVRDTRARMSPTGHSRARGLKKNLFGVSKKTFLRNGLQLLAIITKFLIVSRQNICCAKKVFFEIQNFVFYRRYPPLAIRLKKNLFLSCTKSATFEREEPQKHFYPLLCIYLHGYA